MVETPIAALATVTRLNDSCSDLRSPVKAAGQSTVELRPKLPFLVEIMPATTRRSRLTLHVNEDVMDLSGNPPHTKKLRTRSPASYPPAQTRSRNNNRTPLGGVSLSRLNKDGVDVTRTSTATSLAMASPSKEIKREEVAIVSGRKIKRASSRSREKEALSLPSNKPSVTPTTTERKKTKPPRKLDRFRVFYDKCDDAFGKERSGAKGHFHGTVRSVSRPRKAKDGSITYKIVIEFDNGERVSFDYPSSPTDPIDSVERLIASCEGPSQLMGELSGQFAGDLSPPRLDVGDLVFCNYQNKERWYRGRIAAISEDEQVCDVVYDDGELEQNVPLNQDKITLIEDGIQYQHWLEGLQVKLPLGASRQAVCTIRLLAEEEDFVEVVHDNNGKVEKQSYHTVVRLLFEELKRTAKTVCVWPHTELMSEGSNMANASKNLVSAAQPIPQATVALARKRVPTKKKQISPMPPTDGDGSQRLCRPEDFATNPWEADLSEDEVDKDADESVRFKDMSNSVRNSFWKALNSSDSHFGESLLFKVTNFHNKVPNDALCKDIVNLLWRGPLYQGTQFPDHIRMELANNYLDLLKSKVGIGPRLSKALPPSFVQDFLEQVEKPSVNAIYCVEGDEARTTSAALRRVGQSLLVKNSGASMFLYLLQGQLRGYQRFGKHADPSMETLASKEMKEFAEELCRRDLTRDILEAGSSKALKLAVRATFSILVHYGHYLSHDFVFPPAPARHQNALNDPIPPHGTLADQEFVAMETRRLLKTLGQLCSLLAWLHSIDEAKPLYECRFLVRDSVDGFLSSSSFDPSIFLNGGNDQKRMNKHWADMRLQFALSLDKRISGLLGKHLAQLFKLGQKYF